jgi:SAM-dependent methyltransferase
MGDLNRTTYFYRKKFVSKLAQFNREIPLPDYFAPMIGDKKEVIVAELGAGPINTIGNFWKGVTVVIRASDVMQPEYEKFRHDNNATLIIPIEYQDMESLTYADKTFDIVHCVNALDHTPNPKKALSEMARVCKSGGWIYLRHAPYQMKRYGGMHEWNIYMEGSACIFQGKKETFTLEGFTSRTEPSAKEDLIVSLCQKT